MVKNELSFTKLKIWQKSHDLTIKIYKLTENFPEEEKFGLVSQLRRAAVSIESCIAEGHGRYYYAETVKFLRDARRSLFEAQTQLLIAKDLNLVNIEEVNGLIKSYTNLTKQINSYISYKKRKKKKSEK